MPEIKDLAAPGKLLSTIGKLSKIYEQKKRVLCDTEGDSTLQLYDANMADEVVDSIRLMQKQSRIFAKTEVDPEPSCSKQSTATSTNNETIEKKR